ncbi:MAG: hypothetical protein IJM68_00920 [Synergistaceae bacterium]|nr:hypothetical protein [Synergistaceae bacterium]
MEVVFKADAVTVPAKGNNLTTWLHYSRYFLLMVTPEGSSRRFLCNFTSETVIAFGNLTRTEGRVVEYPVYAFILK